MYQEKMLDTHKKSGIVVFITMPLQHFTVFNFGHCGFGVSAILQS